eukprot:TRINITY_DN111966_c0_g1_i1.p1 TRINITY_DN111966_c0_g1~~TRINITY_DN111966_c0_g1_i1.p1  ORF type:complete len:129 (+),score=23.46 TRINITY_DN111966_c0_g1_i1:77-463(+)
MAAARSAARSEGRFLALRLLPGDDLKDSLLRVAQQERLSAAAVVTCVGSLAEASLRMANAERDNLNEVRSFRRRLEITSLVGTLGCGHEGFGPHCHLHLAVADEDGQAFGGHLLAGCKIFTTAELVLV